MPYISWNEADFTWRDNSYTWGEVFLVEEVATVTGRGGATKRQKEFEKWQKREPEKSKKFVKLICRIKGEKVYEDIKEIKTDDTNISIEDVDIVIKEILGKVYVEEITEK